MSDTSDIVIVVAAAENDVIGRDGGMPWHLPDDLRHFKRITTGHSVIMGRRTWLELGCKPLPDRVNIVLTRDSDFDPAGAIAADSPDAALELARQAHGERDVMVIGGGEIYRLFLDRANRVELTRVHASVDGDVTFGQLGDAWTCVQSDRHEKDDRHGYAFTFETWTRP
ncbi:MAG: dihydrofolate reductase [Phycisphaerales bacterium]|nr:dihydrofolate reductase [Phycisphaerales bacterium]